MKNKIISLILFCGLMVCTNIGLALSAEYGTAIVNAQNSDRVHLRERSSATSNSMGLYFTGTQVLCVSDPDKEWVMVTIGSQSGYMKSDFLYRGTKPSSVKPKQPTAVLNNKTAGSWVNMRYEPSLSSSVAGRIYHGDVVTVLGETVSKWCYVKTGDLYGYMMSDYLLVSGGSSPGTPEIPYATAIVNGQNSDRVHLRELPSATSNSLGLYFTGTKVLCESAPNKEWVKVTIGSQSGYMKSDYLYRGTKPSSVKPKQPTAVLNNKTAGSWVNMRHEPSLRSAVAARIYQGDVVTVLGETVSKWCYVKTGDLYGYMMSDYLTIGSASHGSSFAGHVMLLYKDAPNKKSDIKVQYPKFFGTGFDSLNALMYAKAQSFAKSAYSMYSSDIGLTIDYQSAVTLQNSKIVSVVFWGSSYVEGGIHPFTDLIALNVDLSSMKEITFTDLYTTGAGFEKVFFNKAFFPTNPVTSYEASSFSEMLALQTQEYQGASSYNMTDSFSCFLKPDGIVLSMPAIHATGSDHFEAQLRYSDIQKYYRLGQNYWED